MGLLDFGKKVLGRFGGKDDLPEQHTNLAFVLLSRPQLPRADEVVKAFRLFIPEGPTLSSRADGEDPDFEALLFDINPDSGAMVGLLPIPVPNNEADEAARFSISTFGTGWTLPPHEAHLIVTLQSSSTKLHSLLMFTALLGALVESSSAVGVYWGGAGATHDPKFFVEVAKEGEFESLIALWNGVDMAREPDGRVSLLSLGMNQLDLPDLWLVAPKDNETLPWFFEMLAYIANLGEGIPDGDTVGRSEDEKIPVRYVKSPIDETTEVCRIDVR